MPTVSNQQSPKKQQKSTTLQRLDNLPFSRWHFFMVLSLGLVWIFDGYEVSLISLFRSYIVKEHSQATFKSLATSYQIGCIVGSLVFGIAGFGVGRKKIFLITLIIYAFGILFSIISQSVLLFLFGRFLTGIRYMSPKYSIGGQFTAIFTAIDEFLPPKYRGRVNIGIDGTWHLGGSFAAVLNMVIGETARWRQLFTIGLVGILSLLIMRKNIPESPRWLILKGKDAEADLVVKSIQNAVENKKIMLQTVTATTVGQLDNAQNELVSQRSQIDQKDNVPLGTQPSPSQDQNTSLISILQKILITIASTIKKFKSRFFLAFYLMFAQAFFFNLIYYKFPSTLQNHYKLDQSSIGLYMLPLSLSSFVSTLVVGPLFDKIGRKQLLLVTYAMSGILLILSQYVDSLIGLQVLICCMFFFTSPAGSSANLIASEIFPTNSRTLILFIMFIVGMFGGIAGVWVDTVWLGSIIMIVAGILGYILCPKSENKSLEQIQHM